VCGVDRVVGDGVVRVGHEVGEKVKVGYSFFGLHKIGSSFVECPVDVFAFV